MAGEDAVIGPRQAGGRRDGADGDARRRRAASAPATTSASAPSSSASQAARAAGALASGAGRARAAVTMCAGRPDREAAGLQRPVELGAGGGDAEARVAFGEGPGRLLDGEEADAPPRLARRRRGRGVAGARQRTSGWPSAARASRQAAARGPPASAAARKTTTRPHRRRGLALGGDGAQAARAGGVGPGADDLDAEGAGDAVELLDADEGADGARIGEAAGGDALGEGLEQVDALGGELGLDRLGDRVVGDDLVDVVVLGGAVMADLEHDVEADALGDAALGAEGADLDAAGIVADRDAVERRADVGRRGARVRQLEGDGGLVHVLKAPAGPRDGDSAGGVGVQGKVPRASRGCRVREPPAGVFLARGRRWARALLPRLNPGGI